MSENDHFLVTLSIVAVSSFQKETVQVFKDPVLSIFAVSADIKLSARGAHAHVKEKSDAKLLSARGAHVREKSDAKLLVVSGDNITGRFTLIVCEASGNIRLD